MGTSERLKRSENNASESIKLASANHRNEAKKETDICFGSASQAAAIQRINTSVRMKTQNNIINGIESNATSQQSIQCIRVGYVPRAPGLFRATTNIAYNGYGVPHADKAFDNPQRADIHTNNITNGGGAAPIVVGANHEKEDIGGGAALLNRDAVSDIEPEVDHIVPRANGGANDNDNARVISKTHNTDGSASRPTNAQKGLRLYETIAINDVNGTVVRNNGDILGDTDIASLCDYCNINPGDMQNIPNGDLATVIATPRGNRNRGIGIT